MEGIMRVTLCCVGGNNSSLRLLKNHLRILFPVVRLKVRHSGECNPGWHGNRLELTPSLRAPAPTKQCYEMGQFYRQ